jgi:CRP-like cAMP-binding protein/Fe-S-cluster-containing dehydrogenase component/ferredoxin
MTPTATTSSPPSGQVELVIDGQRVAVPPGTTIFDAARALNIEIPTLCHAQHQTPVGVCRICTVEVRNNRVLAASCIRPVESGMEVRTATEQVLAARRILYELLLADHPSPCRRQQATSDCELESQAQRVGLEASRFARDAALRGTDDSSLIIRVDHAACILCDRCIRGCNEIKHNLVIGRTGKGSSTGIAFDLDVPMEQSTCVGCGECMVSCPTGALTNKGVVDVTLPAGQPVTPDELLALPVFLGTSGTFLNLNRGSVVRRTFKAGEVICRQGEFGSTAFYLLSGAVEVSLATPLAHVKSTNARPGGIASFLRRLSHLAGDREDPRASTPHRRIPIDGPVDLDFANPVARLGPGEIFGEMTCMSYYPRSATVVALEETQVLEMLRNVLHVLQKNKSFRGDTERRYRERALGSHLRGAPILADVPDEALGHLCERVEMLRYSPGEVICRQGDPAASLFLIRVGFVKVTQAFPGGEMVVAYLSRGHHFGEIGLLEGGVRTATCTAVDHVEVVRATAKVLEELMDRFPEVRTRLTATAQTRLAENERLRDTLTSVPLGEFLDQGLMQAQSLLLLDLEKCTRCDLCVRACADAHGGVTRLVRDGVRFDKYLVATSCRSCRDPLCMVGCPVGAIRRRDSLEILIEDWCIGCGLCAENCPYGNINLHPFPVQVADREHPGQMKRAVVEKATTCDLSRELPEPACVYACPHGATIRVEPLTFFAGRFTAPR